MEDCIFCKIIQKTLPSKIVFEDDRIVAFEDINPKAPVHILIIPKVHYASLKEIPGEEKDILSHILMCARNIAQDHGIGDSGFRIVLNTGPDSGQEVFHIHFHLFGGRRMSWPPG